jgi:hypothetical protein
MVAMALIGKPEGIVHLLLYSFIMSAATFNIDRGAVYCCGQGRSQREHQGLGRTFIGAARAGGTVLQPFSKES